MKKPTSRNDWEKWRQFIEQKQTHNLAEIKRAGQNITLDQYLRVKRQEIFQERLYWHKRKNDNRLKEWNIESASEIEALQELDREVERHCELTKEIAKKWNDAEEKSEILLELREFLKLYKKDPWTFPKKWGKDGSFGARNAFGNVLQGFIAQKRWPKKREIMQLMRDRRYNVTSSTFDRCLDFYDVKDVFKAEKESIKKV